MVDQDLWVKIILQWREARILSSRRIVKSGKGCIIRWLRFMVDQDLWVKITLQWKYARKGRNTEVAKWR